MKNYFGVLVLLLFLVYSCDKVKQSDDLVVVGAEKTFLTFDEVEAYEAALADKEKAVLQIQQSPTFSSFQQKFKSYEEDELLEVEGLEDYVAEDRILHLLNEYQTIQLGDWICQLDFRSKTVYVLHESQWEEVQNNQLNTVPAVQNFSFEEEVASYIEIAMEDGVELQEAKELFLAAGSATQTAARAVCPGVDSKKKEKEKCGDLQYTSGVDSKTYSAKVKLVYQKAGIYFSVKAQVKNYRTWVGCNLNTTGLQFIEYGEVTINKRKTRRRGLSRYCVDDFTGGQFAFTVQREGGAYDVDGSRAILRNKLYEGTKGLQDLYVAANFVWGSHSGGVNAHQILFIIEK